MKTHLSIMKNSKIYPTGIRVKKVISFIQRLFSGLKQNQIGLKLSAHSKKYAVAAIAVAFLFFGSTEKSSGQFLTEDFSYTTGTLLSANGYSAFSGGGTNSLTVTTPGLSYSGSTASGVGNAVSFSGSGEDAGRGFTAVTSGSLYISFLAKISAAQSGGDYCIAVSTGTFTAFAVRLYVKSSGAGYVLGCSKGTGTIAYDGTIRNFSDTYQIVMKYTYNTGTATDDIVDLWINPALGGTEGTPTISTVTGGSDASAAGLTGFAIRQGGASTAASGIVDGFKLGTTWASVTPAGVIPPVMTISRTSIGLGNVQVGNSSASDSSYLVTGTNLTAPISLQFNPSTTVFEMSLTQGSGYTSTLSLTPDMSGSVSQTIYVRFSPAATGSVSSTIEHTSTGATQQNVVLSGTGTNCSPPTITAGGPTDFCAPGSVTLTADAGASYLWSTTETTQSITVSTSGSYSVTVEDFFSCSATSAPTVVNVSTFGFSGAIFSENVGNPGATIAMALYTGWQNQGILSFTSTSVNNSDVRISAPSSTSHYATASGQGNVFLGTSGGNTKDFIIAGINTTGYTGLSFTFGLLRTLGSPNTPEEILVSVSTDGTTYTPLTTSTQPAFSTSTYGLVTVSSGIPATSNLRIKFSKTTNTSFRIDDMVLSGSVGSVSISASGPTSICAGTSVTLTSNVPGGNDWDPYFSFSQSITVNAAGTYATTVTDNQGCTATSNAITVSIVAAPSGVTSVTDVLCAGGSTGTASVVASGGAGTYTYSWDSSPIQTGSTATGLPAGTYIVTITDAGGCTGTASAIVAEPLPLQVTASSTKPSTIGGNDGTATGSAFDGTSPYSYSWNTAPIQNTDIATGLLAGTYTVTVTDANLCTASTSVTVVDPIPTITVSTTALADFGSVVLGNPSAEQSYTVSGVDLSTAIVINAPTGFEISETSGSGFGNSISLPQSGGIVLSTLIYARFNPVANGATSLLITHTSTGATQKDVTVSGTGIPCAQATISASGPLSFCTGGSVTLTASSGASYLWSTTETTQSIVVTTSGSYTVEVTDNSSCVSTSSATVVTVSSFSYTGVLFSENMGTPGGNTFVNSYTGWQNPGATFQSTLANQSDVRTSTNSAGAYTDASGDGNVFMGTAGGTDPRDFIISGINTLGYSGITLSFGMLRTAPDTLFVSVSSDGVNYSSITTTHQPVTNNSWALVHDSIGTIPSVANLYLKFSKSTSTSFRIDDVTLRGTTNTFAVTANGPTTICSGKTLVLSSNIASGNNWSPFPSLSQSINVTDPGTYSCTVTDSLGCSLTSASFTVSVNPSPMVDTLISTNLLCYNDSSGTIEAVVSGGTTPYTYNWNSLPVQTTLTAVDLHSGFYTFTVTADNGCTASQGRFVSQPTPLVVSASVISHPTSIGASDGSIASVAGGGTVPYTYSWDSSPIQTSDTAIGLQAGIYTVTVVDSNGCNVTASDTLLDPLPAITVTPTSLPAFPNTLIGNTSTEQSYTVSGIYLTDPILINAPTGFEISETSGSGFGSFISLAHSGGIVGPVTIYVHFKPVTGGTISPVITHESTGAVQKDVTVTGTGVTCSPAFITPSGPTTFCAGGSVTLTASAGDTYLWSNGETTASITTDTSGTFSVVVTDAFSCSSTAAPLTVTVNTFKFIGTIFSENMGSSGGTVALNTYTGWQNYGALSFSTSPVGPSDVRISSGSPTPTFSGGSNVFLGTSGGNSKDFFIKGVNTMGYSNMVLSFGMLRTNTSEDLQVSVSSDTGQTYVALTTTTQPSGSTTVWGAAPIIASGAIPNSPNLYIKFSKSTSTQFRVDDVKLTGETSIVSITANGPTDFCQGSQVTLASNIPSLNLWSPGSETTKSIVVNSTGSYGLTATDGNGCTASAIPVTVNVNQIPVVNATATDVTCNAGTDGTATANVTAGTSPFTYSWNSSPVQTTQTATGLAAGTYKVVVTGAIGCKDSATAVVGEPTAIVANCSVVNHVTCNGGSDGATSVSGTGGTGIITVSGAATSGLTAGSYTYTLTDASGCSTTCTLVITEPAAIVANCSVVNHVTCNGGTDGATSVSGTGGTGAITVSGAATSGLTAGSYMYTLTDASGCSTTCTVVITEPAAIVISSLSPSTGPVGTSVTISGSGFTGATDVQFNGLTTTYTVDNDGQISTTVPVGATTGPVTVLVGSCQGVSAGNFTVTTASGLDLDLRVFLEGYITEDWKNGFGGDTMRSTLYDLEQGTILTGPYSSTATDTIEVNLWTSASVLLDPNTTPPDYSEKVILNNNGRVTVNFATAPAGDYYIAVKHKNTIETWSSNLVTFAAGTTSYDFSTALTQAYDDGNNPPMATMPYGVFALYSGDNTQDGTVDSQDMNPVYNDNNAQLYDYLNTDCTGDGTTDSQDMNFVYNNSNLQLFYARPY